MSALAGLAKNANNAATTPTRNSILVLFFDIIPIIWIPPIVGLQWGFFITLFYAAGVKAMNTKAA
jgi:hypothetical protein